jgi:hypothetical protein
MALNVANILYSMNTKNINGEDARIFEFARLAGNK